MNVTFTNAGRKMQGGFASTEYAIIAGATMLALFAAPNLPSALVDAIKAFYKALTFYISLP
jgi:Flp pilus assembly pilin Flp